MAPGTGEFDVGAYINTLETGGYLHAIGRFDDTWFGFADARGGYSFLHASPFGEATAGIGARW